MTVLYVHVEDDWTEFPTNEYQIFADTEAGLAKAIDYAGSNNYNYSNHCHYC